MRANWLHIISWVLVLAVCSIFWFYVGTWIARLCGRLF